MPAELGLNLEAALDYLRRGWLPIPLCWPTPNGRCGCGRNHQGRDLGKAPLLGTGYQDVRPSEADVRRWWHKSPRANVGILLEPSGLLVVDCDSPEALQDALKRGLPPTPVVQTGKGHHYYYQAGEVAGRATKQGDSHGIDVLSKGYVVAPPSRHPSGRLYEWRLRPDDAPLQEAPTWAVDLLRKAEAPTVHPPTGDGAPPVRLTEAGLKLWRGEVAVDKADGRPKPSLEVGEVDRSETLFVIGKELARGGATSPTIAAALADRDRTLYAKYATRRDGGNVEYGRIAEKVLADTRPDAGPGSNGRATLQPRTITAADLSSKHFPEPRWVVPDLLPEGAAVVAARPKTGKSFLALDVALAVALGGCALGAIRVEAGDVLYLGLEDGERRLQARMEALLGGEPAPERLHFATEWPTLDQGGIQALEGWLDGHPDARLIVADTLKRLRPRERAGFTFYGQDYDAIAPLADLARRRCIAILVVHHTRKMQADDALDLVSGTLGLTGAADVVLVLKRARGEREGTLAVMGRDIEEGELALRWETPGWTVLGDAREHQRREERKAVLALLTTRGALTPKEVAEALGKNRSTVRWLLRQMATDGELTVDGVRYGPANTHQHPQQAQHPQQTNRESVWAVGDVQEEPSEDVGAVGPVGGCLETEVHPASRPLLPFDVTKDWQDLPEAALTPPGCEYQLNMTTGRRQVRFDPKAYMGQGGQ